MNFQTNDGSTSLMLAAKSGYVDLTRLLIAKGADVNAKNKYGKTALMYAAEIGSVDITQLLIQAGAK